MHAKTAEILQNRCPPAYCFGGTLKHVISLHSLLSTQQMGLKFEKIMGCQFTGYTDQSYHKIIILLYPFSQPQKSSTLDHVNIF